MSRIDASRPLRVTIVGAGQMAGAHLTALGSVASTHQVVGIMDAREGAARQLAERVGANAYTDLDKMLAAEKPDIVHIITPAGTHVGPAEKALRAGASVYVEKPFTESLADAEHLLRVAQETGQLICSGHQLIRQPAYADTLRDAQATLPLVLADSVFCFRSPTVRMHRAGPTAKAAQLLDILPHPLYTLIHALESLGSADSTPRLESHSVSPTEISANLVSGSVRGRLLISLRARPVQSTLTLSGERGAVTCDFVHGVPLGAGNAGAGPLEKMLNPIREGGQRMWRTASAITRRIVQGGAYPGLVEIFNDFYAAVRQGGTSPTSAQHLRTVSAIYEELATAVRATVPKPEPVRVTDPSRPLVVLTGARGFLGREIARELADAGVRVRGLSRRPDPDNPSVSEWARTDLSNGVDPALLAGASAVIHAAAETAGGVEQHERNSIGATRELLKSMQRAGIKRLIYVSSISVLEVPRMFQTQTEDTPLAEPSLPLGPYTWGKTEAEKIVLAEAPALGLTVTIVRPGALMDWQVPGMPGQLGRHLFAKWHLGLGRPSLPIGVIGVDETARILAWMALRQDESPTLVNLNDDRLLSRRDVIEEMKRRGWSGRVFWVPISAIATAFSAARWLLALKSGKFPTPMKPFSILRARRFDRARSREVREKAEAFYRGLGATSSPAAASVPTSAAPRSVGAAL
ncbi:MAG: Gfo/Idh/MocA family oxidoreductase [Gemmatimonadaceae bacterium]